jgi:hypothetical protein
VWHAWVSKYPAVLQSLQQLPELQASVAQFGNLRKSDSDGAIVSLMSALERSIHIFASIQSGSNEHVACLALLAEMQSQCNMNTACFETLRTVSELCNDGNNTAISDSLRLAMAKAQWLNGDHASSMAICSSILEQESVSLSTEAAARTGQALSRLLLVSSLDDAFSVRDPFRGVIKLLERNAVSSNSTIKAAAHLNMGIAEAVYAENVAKFNDVEVPLDGAMRAWRAGLTELKQRDNRATTPSPLRTFLQARLQASMAWGMLQMTRERDFVPRACTLASESLATLDSLTGLENHRKEGLCRTLGILATCYHQSGSAVTAQGLFQSAIDHDPLVHATLVSLERRDALMGYSKLCHEWDKRESEAVQLKEQADLLNHALPVGWRDKSTIHGSLWFWTPDSLR